jgi:hypothetical protein
VTDRRSLLMVGVVAIVAAVVAVLAGPNFGVALFLGGAAALAGGLVAILVLADRVRRTHGPAVVVDSEILLSLRDSLRSGSIGRQRVIAAVQSVDRAAGAEGGVPVGAEEERRIVELPQEAFRAWLAEQLDRLERET